MTNSSTFTFRPLRGLTFSHFYNKPTHMFLVTYEIVGACNVILATPNYKILSNAMFDYMYNPNTCVNYN